MRDPCPKGMIWRVGYKKSSKKTSVKGKCINATSQTGKKTSIEMRHKLEKIKKNQALARERFGTPKCKPGYIVREGYKRTSKSGKTVVVKPVCVKDVGKKGKQERLFYVEPGRLSTFGYDDLMNRSQTERRNALRKAFTMGEEELSVERRLVALATFNKNTNPKLAGILKSDADWISVIRQKK